MDQCNLAACLKRSGVHSGERRWLVTFQTSPNVHQILAATPSTDKLIRLLTNVEAVFAWRTTVALAIMSCSGYCWNGQKPGEHHYPENGSTKSDPSQATLMNKMLSNAREMAPRKNTGNI